MRKTFKLKQQGSKESDISRYCKNRLECERELFFYRNNTGAYKSEANRFVRFGYKGSSDYYVFFKGHIGFLELKKNETEKLRDTQEEFKQKVESVECFYFKAGSVDEIEKFIVEFKQYVNKRLK